MSLPATDHEDTASPFVFTKLRLIWSLAQKYKATSEDWNSYSNNILMS